MRRLFLAWVAGFAMAAGAASAQTAGRPQDGFFTRDGALVCVAYSALREGQAAVRARDTKWLKEAGCAVLPGGLKVDLIDAPWSSNAVSDETWYFRLYQESGESAGNWYAKQSDIHVFGKTEKYSDEETARKNMIILWNWLKNDWMGKYITHIYVFPDSSDWRIWVGPSDHKTIYLGCSHVWSMAWDSKKMARREGAPTCEPAALRPMR